MRSRGAPWKNLKAESARELAELSNSNHYDGETGMEDELED
jgi:hypothetical protein